MVLIQLDILENKIYLYRILIILDAVEFQRLTDIDGRVSVSFEQPFKKIVVLSVI